MSIHSSCMANVSIFGVESSIPFGMSDEFVLHPEIDIIEDCLYPDSGWIFSRRSERWGTMA